MTRTKLNDSKTEFIIFGTRKQASNINQTSINVSGDDIKAKTSVRHICSILDTELNTTKRVSHVLKVGYFQLRQLRVIRKYLKILIHTSLISMLDYANALLYGIAETQLKHLQ